MRLTTLTAAFTLVAAPALAESHAMGDAAAGEADFKKCKACHTIASADEVIQKGGKTGPNLYNVVGRTVGSVEDFRYSGIFEAANEAGLVWDEENLVAYLQDPTKHIRDWTGEKGRSKMTFKLRKGAEDMAAYLKSVSPDAAMAEEEGADSGS